MRKKQNSRVKRKKGLPPGTLVYTGANIAKSESTLYRYDSNSFELLPIGQLASALKQDGSLWIDMRGLENVALVGEVGQLMNMHPLAIEDVLNTHQRTKLEDYHEGLFFVLHHIKWNTEHNEITTEQIALHWDQKHVASFQELPDDTFAPITSRLKDNSNKMRQSGPDYLAYTMIDLIVDSHFDVLDELSEQIVDIQERIKPNVDLAAIRTEISNARQQLSKLRRAIVPLREALGKLNRSDVRFIKPENQVYFRDTLDHAGQIIDYLENLYEDLNTTHELYTSEMNQRLNQITKLLTMISTIFIPLSFIAGIYGMNFDIMPELKWQNGYYYTLGFMALSALAMLGYFWRKRWL
jgi:magnesium transporter